MTRTDRTSSPSPRASRLLLVIAAVMWSTSGFFAKAPLFDNWPLEQRGPLLAFWRALFASLILVPMVRQPRWNPRLIPMVLLFATMNYVYLNAMAYTTAANAIWLQNTAPLWVFLVGVVCFGESVHRGDLWLLLLSMCGIGVILAFEIRGQAVRGIVFGLLSGLTYAGVVLCIRQLRQEESAWLVALNHVVTAVVFFPGVVAQGIWPTGPQWVYLAAFGMLQMGLPYLLFARGLRAISGHEAAGIVLLEPILVPVWVFLAWRQAPNYQPPEWWTLVGGGLILGGLLMRYLAVRRPTPPTAVAQPSTSHGSIGENQQLGGETENGDQQ